MSLLATFCINSTCQAKIRQTALLIYSPKFLSWKCSSNYFLCLLNVLLTGNISALLSSEGPYIYIYFFFFINLFIFIYLFLAVLGLRFCARAFSSCCERGPLFIAVRGPLTILASLVAEHRLQTHRLSNRGSRAQLLRGMWDLPRPGLEPVSPALAGRFSTTAPPGKPHIYIFKLCFTLLHEETELYFLWLELVCIIIRKEYIYMSMWYLKNWS